MQSSSVKYGFRIRTRHGMLVENLSIHGRDEADAERKLRQMYPHCQVIECAVVSGERRGGSPSFEEFVSLLNK